MINASCPVARSAASDVLQEAARKAALAVAESSRDQSANVLLVMVSLTRLAMAQREIGLAAGQPPSPAGDAVAIGKPVCATRSSAGRGC